jgi:hypothetical protein
MSSDDNSVGCSRESGMRDLEWGLTNFLQHWETLSRKSFQAHRKYDVMIL